MLTKLVYAGMQIIASVFEVTCFMCTCAQSYTHTHTHTLSVLKLNFL